MSRIRALALAAGLAACGSPTDGGAPAGPPAVRIEVTPGGLRLPVGGSVTLVVRGVSASGTTAPLPAPATITSLDPSVATVSAQGLVTATRVGDARIEVAWTGGTVLVGIAVLGPPVRADVPGDSIVLAPGFSTDRRIVLRDAAGHDVGDDAPLHSADASVVRVSAGWTLEGVRPGATEVTVPGETGSFTLRARVVSVPGALAMGIPVATGAPAETWEFSQSVEFLAVDGSAPTLLSLPERLSYLTLSPDGAAMAAVRENRELALVDLPAGTVRLVPGMPSGGGTPATVPEDVAWTPDGARLLYTGLSGGTPPRGVFEIALAGGGPRFLTIGARAQWIEQDRLLAWECGVRPPQDTGSGICVDRPDAAAPALPYPWASRALPKPGTEELALASIDTEEYPALEGVVTFPGGRQARVPGRVTSISWSPDGRWLAVATNPFPIPSSRGEWPRVWLLGPDVALPLWRAARTSVTWRPAASR